MSTRVRRLYLTAPALWQDITIEAGAEVAQLGVLGLSVWRHAKSALLRRTAGMARSVRLRSAGPAPGEPPAMWQLIGAAMGSLLPRLPSPVLEELHIQVWQLVVHPPTLGAALAPLPALKRLSVGPPSEAEEAGLFDLSFLEGPLLALAQLERLRLIGQDLPPGVIASLPSLSQLTSLTISTARPLPEELAECLAQLPGLQKLTLVEASSTEEGMPLLEPTFLVHPITQLHLGARRIQAGLAVRACIRTYQDPLPQTALSAWLECRADWLGSLTQPALPSAGACYSRVQRCAVLMPTWRRTGAHDRPGHERGALHLLGSNACAAPVMVAARESSPCQCQRRQPACNPCHLTPAPLSLGSLQCACCDSRTVAVRGVCMEHSAPLLSLLWAAGAGTGQMNHLELTDCHVSSSSSSS